MVKSTGQQRLGGNLSAILGNVGSLSSADSAPPVFKQIRVNEIKPGRFQPRRIFDENDLCELSQSIKSQGILQPILVQEAANKGYEIIAGERRWRAAQIAELTQIPALICKIDDKSALAFGVIENIQRQDLNPIEEASALKKLIDEFEMTHDEVAKSVGRSRAAVSNLLRLLSLSPVVQKYLIFKELDIGHAKVLMVFPPSEQEHLASIIISKKLTVREAEKLAHSKKASSKIAGVKSELHSRCDEWSSFLTKRLKSKVSVKVDKMGVGKLSIEMNSEDEIFWFLRQLQQ